MKKLSVLVGFILISSIAASLLRAQSPAKKSNTTAKVEQTSTVATQNPPAKVAPEISPAKVEPESSLMKHLHAGMILDYATYLVVVITAIFAIFLAVLGIFEWRRVEALKKEVSEERKALREELRSLIESSKSEFTAQEQRLRTELAAERKESEARIDRIETLEPELGAQQKRVLEYQRFLEAWLAHHSRLLVGIVKGFGTALKPEEVTMLNSLISEAESALDLFHPDKAVIRRALLRLEQIGSHGSVSSLAELRDDGNEDPEIRLRAQEVLARVKEHIKRERVKVP